MKALIHKILYRTLPLEGYLRVVSRMFFLWQRLRHGPPPPAPKDPRHNEKLQKQLMPLRYRSYMNTYTDNS